MTRRRVVGPDVQDAAEALTEVLVSTVGLVLESKSVSVRLAAGALGGQLRGELFRRSRGAASSSGEPDDHNRFLALAKERKSFSTAFLDFEPVGRRASRVAIARFSRFRSRTRTGSSAEIIAYDKSPDDPLEDAVYTELDRKLLANLSESRPAGARRDSPAGATGGRGSDPGALDLVLVGEPRTVQDRSCADEISPFGPIPPGVQLSFSSGSPALKTLFGRDRARASRLVEDISQGLETRTRKTDIGEWIGLDTYAVLTLDARQTEPLSRFAGDERISPKDLSTLDRFSTGAENEILVGSATLSGLGEDRGRAPRGSRKEPQTGRAGLIRRAVSSRTADSPAEPPCDRAPRSRKFSTVFPRASCATGPSVAKATAPCYVFKRPINPIRRTPCPS